MSNTLAAVPWVGTGTRGPAVNGQSRAGARRDHGLRCVCCCCPRRLPAAPLEPGLLGNAGNVESGTGSPDSQARS